MPQPPDTTEVRVVFRDGTNRVVSGRAALVVLKIVKHADTINDPELRGKFWINLQGKAVETTLEMSLTD